MRFCTRIFSYWIFIVKFRFFYPDNKNEINSRIYTFPTSAILSDGKKINYFDFISSLKNTDCNQALKRIASRIDMEKINNMINDIPCISDIQKQFYITMLRDRKKLIIDYSYDLLKKIESN